MPVQTQTDVKLFIHVYKTHKGISSYIIATKFDRHLYLMLYYLAFINCLFPWLWILHKREYSIDQSNNKHFKCPRISTLHSEM